MKTGHDNTTNLETSVLELLESIVNVGWQPERFSDVCHGWAERSDEVSTLTNSQILLDSLYVHNSQHFKTLKSSAMSQGDLLSQAERDRSFIVDQKLCVISVGNECRAHLQIGVGDTVKSLFIDASLSSFQTLNLDKGEAIYIDLMTAKGLRHLSRLSRVKIVGDRRMFFRLTLQKVELSQEADNHIRTQIGLTNAEVEILKLVLKRLSLDAISQHRRSTLNTTRKHINNIKNKFGSHSLSDVISITHEIMDGYRPKGRIGSVDTTVMQPVHKDTMLCKLTIGANQIEYSSYGRPGNKTLIILHSLEYGILPPRGFIKSAVECGYRVYTPIRPGYGRSSFADSIEQSAEFLRDFIQSLKLKNVTIVALSTASPTLLALLKIYPNIEQSVFVNYAFDTPNKIDAIKPTWIRGLLDFGLGSDESFKFAFRMTKAMLKIIGHRSFYQRLYGRCEYDLRFITEYDASFKAAANLILSAQPQTCREELRASFLDMPILDHIKSNSGQILSVFGDHTHGITHKPIRHAAQSLNIPFHVLESSGRNCIYQQPELFFTVLEQVETLKQSA